jgi:hypothetical protein
MAARTGRKRKQFIEIKTGKNGHWGESDDA